MFGYKTTILTLFKEYNMKVIIEGKENTLTLSSYAENKDIFISITEDKNDLGSTYNKEELRKALEALS